MSTRIEYLPTSLAEIRARRRPRALALVWLFELLAGFLLATPIHAWARRVWGSHPDGDAILFAPGGRALLTWLGEGDASLTIVTREVLVLLFVVGLASTIVLGAVVAMLATDARETDTIDEARDGTLAAQLDAPSPRIRAVRTPFALATGLTAFLPSSAAAILFTVLQTAVLALGLAAATAIGSALAPGSGDARAFTWSLVVFVPFVAGALFVGVFSDVARVAIARGIATSDDARSGLGWLRHGLAVAFRTMRARGGSLFGGWAWRAAIALLLVVVGGWAGTRAGAAGGSLLLLLFAFHQLLVLGRAALRVSFLAQALRALVVEPPAQARSDL